jgi:hypothetical protein
MLPVLGTLLRLRYVELPPRCASSNRVTPPSHLCRRRARSAAEQARILEAVAIEEGGVVAKASAGIFSLLGARARNDHVVSAARR